MPRCSLLGQMDPKNVWICVYLTVFEGTVLTWLHSMQLVSGLGFSNSFGE